MVKYLRCVFSSLMAIMLSGCVQKIDFEHDVPQRAKSISKQQADKVRTSMEVPELKKKYQDYVMQQKNAKSITDLEKEKRDIEKRISHIIQSNNSKVCSICKKKFNVKASPKRLVVRKGGTGKHKAKVIKKGKKPVQASISAPNGPNVNTPVHNTLPQPQQILAPQQQAPQMNMPPMEQPMPQQQQPMPPQPFIQQPQQPFIPQPPQPFMPMLPMPAY